MRGHINIETLRGKNTREIRGALSDVCVGFIVDLSKVSHWGNRFREGCVSIVNDPRLGRSRISTDERSVKLVADALEEDRRAKREELSRATGAKNLLRKRHKNRTLLVAGPLVLNENVRPHTADVVTKKTAFMCGKCYLMQPTVQT